MSDHPTPPSGMPATSSQISSVEIVARLVDIQRSVDKIDGTVGELKGSIGELKGSVVALRKVDESLTEGFQALTKRVESLEGRVKSLEEDRDQDRRERSEERDARAKETEAIISHVSRLEDAMRAAVQPIAERVAALEKNDAARVLAMRAQDEQLATVVNLLTKLGRWQFPWWAKFALSIGFAIGGAVAGYIAAGGH